METNQIISLYTNLTEEEQAQICFESAYEWLEWILPAEPMAKEWMPLNPSFWPWWTAQWKALDNAFIDSIDMVEGEFLVAVPLSTIKTKVHDENHMAEVWKDWHNVRFVAINTDLINKTIQQSIINQIHI